MSYFASLSFWRRLRKTPSQATLLPDAQLRISHPAYSAVRRPSASVRGGRNRSDQS